MTVGNAKVLHIHLTSMAKVKDKEKSKSLVRLWDYGADQRSYIIWAITMSVLKKIFDIAPEILIGVAIDVIVRNEESFVADLTGVEDQWHQLIILAALNFIVWVLESITQYLGNIAWRNIAQSIQHSARIDAYKQIQDLEMEYFEDSSTGGLLSILNDDVNQLERFLDEGANKIIMMLVNIIGVTIIFFFVSPLIALVAFLPIPVILIGSFGYQKKLVPLYDNIREKVSQLNGSLANNISGISTIRAFTNEDIELKRIEGQSNEYLDANKNAIKLSSAFTPIIRIAILTGFTSTLLLGGWLAIQGEIEVSSYSVLVFMTQRLLWPLTELGVIFDSYQRAMSSVRRIFRLVDSEPTIEQGSEQLAHPIKGTIEFKNVNFAYSDGQQILNNLNLSIPAGETHAIVGLTGSGKSTIIKLLLRFYEPSSGEISVEDVPINLLSFAELRGITGLVSQDVFLFDGTVEENIAYGKPGSAIEEIKKSAKLAEADEFVNKLEFGYQTVVGERGQKLSGGQRQRLSIARSILRDPKILILDEATSSVDNETEAAIQKSLEVVAKNRTTLIIAHRLSTIRNADKIHLLENGTVTDSGTHDELNSSDNLYSALWKVQTGEIT